MGRVILTLKSGRKESYKCKSKERAGEIAKKRKDVNSFDFYEDNERVPIPKKKKVNVEPMTFEVLEAMMKKQGLLY